MERSWLNIEIRTAVPYVGSTPNSGHSNVDFRCRGGTRRAFKTADRRLTVRRRIDKFSLTQWVRRLVPALKRENIMARKPAPKLDEKALTKGELRKLNAIRKSVGEDIGDKAFVEWLRKKPVVMIELEDKNATLIADTLMPLIEQNKLRIPRGGYLILRGRGRVIVVRPDSR